MKLLTITFLAIFYLHCAGQVNHHRNLLDTALRSSNTLFVFAKPISNLKLDKGDMPFYIKNLRDWSEQMLDTTMFLQIIENAKNMDTSFWTDNEMPFSLLVNNRDEYVSKKYAFKKFLLVGKKQERSYNKRINEFNRTDPVDRDITYFSRPVFDNTGQFAVVERENGHSWLGGGGNIILYHLQGDAWREVGLMNWRY